MPFFRDLQQLHERVWLFPKSDNPREFQPNIGLLQADDQTILIDSGNSPRHARQVLAEMVGTPLQPVNTVIYTHHHWDNTFGTMGFNPRYVIAHQACYEALKAQVMRPWGSSYLREETYRNPILEERNSLMHAAVGDWAEFRVVLPTITFRSVLRVYYSASDYAELRHVGGEHAPDSVIVRLPSAGIVFLGDALCPTASGGHDMLLTPTHWQHLAAWITPDYQLYVDGHDVPRSYEEMRQLMQEGDVS